MTWNKKNQQFALSCDIRRSTLELCQYILRRAKPGQVVEIEVDLRVANKWLGKHRPKGEYDRKTIKEALWQLDEKTNGWILVTKSYTWAVHKVLVRPLEMVLQEKSQNGDKTPKLNRGNPMFSEADKKTAIKQQQQDISKIDYLLSNLGMKFSRDVLVDMYRKAGKSVEEVKKAVKFLLFKHSTQREPITNPHGWLRTCLQFKRQDEYDPYYQLKLPFFSNTSDLETFVDSSCLRNDLRYET